MPSPTNQLDERPHIAIVGGGISGLASAHRLTELLPAADLTLFEASDRLGGVLQTVHRDDCLVERAADSFITKMPWATGLCHRLGLSDQLLTTNSDNRRAFVVRDGELLPVPEGFVLMTPRQLWPILTTRALSWRGKARLLVEPLIRERQPIADESVASFATRRLGRETFERIVQPLLVGIYTSDPAKLSMAATMPEILRQLQEHRSLLRAGRKQAELTEHQADDGAGSSIVESGARYGMFVAPRNGMGSLVDALARRMPEGVIQLGTSVSSVRRDTDGGWQLGLQPGGDSQHFDAVIVASPAPAAARLVQHADEELARELAQIEYAGCGVVCLGYRRDQIGELPAGFGFVVPLVERRQILAASFASEKFPHRAPSDHLVVRVFVGGALQPQLVDLPEAELGGLAHQELIALLKISGKPLWTDVAKWPQSMPQYLVGHLARVARIEARMATLPGLELAGNAYHGVGIPQCIHSGESAAELVAARWTNS